MSGEEEPCELVVGEFIRERAQEISELLDAVDNSLLPKGEVTHGKRTYMQRLPRHLRRRAMTHNVKRLPRKVRPFAETTLANSKHLKKAPSRFRRRRMRNIFQGFARRQRKAHWLQTHIWHAKRFQMADRWGLRLPVRPTQRGYRALCRDAARHTAVQDVSYLRLLQLSGDRTRLLESLRGCTPVQAGAGFGSKATLDGSREGSTIFYQHQRFPLGIVGPVRFMWSPWQTALPGAPTSTLWIWVHPSCFEAVAEELKSIFHLQPTPPSDAAISSDAKVPNNLKQFYLSQVERTADNFENLPSGIAMSILNDRLSRFRLIGPQSTAVLCDSLRLLTDEQQLRCTAQQSSHWWQQWYNSDRSRIEQMLQQKEAWNRIFEQHVAPSQLAAQRCLFAFTVRDPRLFLTHRKQLPDKTGGDTCARELATSLINQSVSSELCKSALWDSAVRVQVVRDQTQTAELDQLRSSLAALPNQPVDLGFHECRIPVLLIQQPGRGEQPLLGYGAGWDLIVPSGWAMPFWLSLHYHTARPAGLCLNRLLALEKSDVAAAFPSCWPDSEAGRVDDARVERELRDKYDRRPHNRRVNYVKLKSPCPFSVAWCALIDCWTNSGCPAGEFYVLRSVVALRQLATCFAHKNSKRKLLDSEEMDNLCNQNHNALVCIRIVSVGKGVPERNAMICMPEAAELKQLGGQSAIRAPVELGERRQKRHRSNTADLENDESDDDDAADVVGGGCDQLFLKMFQDKMQRKRSDRKERLKKKRKARKAKSKTGEQVEKVDGIEQQQPALDMRRCCSRQIMGFVLDGDQSFSLAKGVAIGLVALSALHRYHSAYPGQNVVLYRNSASRCYRTAAFTIYTSFV